MGLIGCTVVRHPYLAQFPVLTNQSQEAELGNGRSLVVLTMPTATSIIAILLMSTIKAMGCVSATCPMAIGLLFAQIAVVVSQQLKFSAPMAKEHVTKPATVLKPELSRYE